MDVTEDYCELLESIKDKESAKKAIDKMDGLADQYAKIAEKAKKAGDTPPDAEAVTKNQEKMKPLVERMTAAATTAMPIISSDPELMKAFQEKQMNIANKMQEASKYPETLFIPRKRKTRRIRRVFQESGTPTWTRTKDQKIKSLLLYQLSYRGFGFLPCGGAGRMHLNGPGARGILTEM